MRDARLPGFYCSAVLVAIGRLPGTAVLTTPSTAAPARCVEQAAGLLAHQACRGDSALATELIQLAFSVPTARRRPRLRLARSRAGLIGRASPAPLVLTRAWELLATAPQLSEPATRHLLAVAGLGEGVAGRALVNGMARVYRLVFPILEGDDLEDVVALLGQTRIRGAFHLQDGLTISVSQLRWLSQRGVQLRGQWLLASPDRRSGLTHAVLRQLAVLGPRTPQDLLVGARRSLVGQPRRHLLPDLNGFLQWVSVQPGLDQQPDGTIASTATAPLSPTDQLLAAELQTAAQVSRARLTLVLRQAGYTPGGAEAMVERTPYLRHTQQRGIYQGLGNKLPRAD